MCTLDDHIVTNENYLQVFVEMPKLAAEGGSGRTEKYDKDMSTEEVREYIEERVKLGIEDGRKIGIELGLQEGIQQGRNESAFEIA